MELCNLCKFNVLFCSCFTKKPTLTISLEKRKYGKKKIVLSGFEAKSSKSLDLLKLLKKTPLSDMISIEMNR